MIGVASSKPQVAELLEQDQSGDDADQEDRRPATASDGPRCVGTCPSSRRLTSNATSKSSRPRRGVELHQSPDALRQAPRSAGIGLQGCAESGDPKYRKLEAVVEEVKAETRELFEARVVWRFFRARSVAEQVALFGDNGTPLVEWALPRQASGEGLCLADYVLPEDHLALFVTTSGRGLRAQSLQWKEEGEYLKSHALAVLALETAEAAAEWIHEKLRADWGFADPESTTRRDLFSARYHGKRYSFGYPACPDLEGQRQLFAALEPGDIGVELTEGDMMDPEGSVSAIVLHHPDAKYFGV